MMKIFYMVIVSFALLLCFGTAQAQSDIGKLLDQKMEAAYHYQQHAQDVPKAWETAVEISTIVQQHPEYDDGEYAEGMIDMVGNLLSKPWKYASPYLIGDKSSAQFRHFVIGHVNELTPQEDLLLIKKNVSQHCDQHKFTYCRDLMVKVKQNLH